MEEKARAFTGKTAAWLLFLLLCVTVLACIPTNDPSDEEKELIERFYLSAAYNPGTDQLQFTIPETLPPGSSFFLHVGGRMLLGSPAIGMSFHAFDQESIHRTWTLGKTYSMRLPHDHLDNCQLVFGILEKNKEEALYQITIHPGGSKKIKKAKRTSESFGQESQPSR